MDAYGGLVQANKREAQQEAREFEAANVKEQQAREAVLRRNLVNRDQLVLQISAQDEVCVCLRARISMYGARTGRMRPRYTVEAAMEAACRVTQGSL